MFGSNKVIVIGVVKSDLSKYNLCGINDSIFLKDTLCQYPNLNKHKWYCIHTNDVTNAHHTQKVAKVELRMEHFLTDLFFSMVRDQKLSNFVIWMS